MSITLFLFLILSEIIGSTKQSHKTLNEYLKKNYKLGWSQNVDDLLRWLRSQKDKGII